MSLSSYVVISPCRNEAALMRRTLDSVIGQTLPPALWVIVDDGSTDESPQVLEAYAAQHAWIRIVRRPQRDGRNVGGGVIDAFYAGFDTITPADFDFICKLDLDLDLPAHYFERLIDRMRADPRLGSCSGKAFYEVDGELVPETIGDDVSVGAAKFYRRDCFQQIGGLVREVMWDGIDCHRARMFGWKACSLADEDLRFLHLRPMGSSQTSMFHGRMRHGRGQYFMGTGIVFMLASALSRIGKAPLLVGSVAMLLGYFRSMVAGQRRYGDPAFRKFLRRYHWLCLTRGKARARQMVEADGEALWDPKTTAPGRNLVAEPHRSAAAAPREGQA